MPKTKPVGRPKLPKGAGKETKLQVRLLRTEEAEIQLAAIRASKTKSEFVREAVLAATRAPGAPPVSPLFQNKLFDRPAVFNPENLMRETRRQKSIPAGSVPQFCVLDPDGDIVAHLLRTRVAERDPAWACYHTTLYRFKRNGMTFGIIGCAVGGPFAVLLAEQLFASGCRLLISITSAGQIAAVREPPYFVLIQRALRDEGASHHYLPPSRYVNLAANVEARLARLVAGFSPALESGAAWTTDAPYRETAEAIAAARHEGVMAVEMEAASLYAFAQAKRKPVVCFANITNRMGVSEGDFEKGEAEGTLASLKLIEAVAQSWPNRDETARERHA